MKHEFGDIGLFNRARAADWDSQALADYLRSTGLTDGEVAEARSLFDVFRSAIENSGVAGLPEITSGAASSAKLRTTSLN